MKHSDKIFFLVSILVLGGSFGYYQMQESALGETKLKADRLFAEEAEGIKWDDVVVPPLKFEQIEWPEVKPQDEEGQWFFQVFTPPSIWVDVDGQFITESPYAKAQARQAFAVKYSGVSNEPYPIQYAGSMGSDKDPIITLKNVAANELYHARLNKPVTKSVPGEDGLAKTVEIGITVKSFDKKRVTNANNTIGELSTLVIFDKKYGKEITIQSDKETVIEESRVIDLILPDGAEWKVKEVGESIVAGGATYTVKNIDFGKENVVVEMIPSNKDLEPQTMILSEEGVTPVK